VEDHGYFKMDRKVLWDILPFTKVNLPGGLSVELVHACPETWPSDRNPDYIIASAARTSFNNFKLEKTQKDDENLIRRLYIDGHTSPFEMANLTFLIKAPKFVTVQILRHRTFRFNEESQRYHQIKDGFFHPSTDPAKFIRAQDQKNKQASNANPELAGQLSEKFVQIESKLEEIFKLYDEVIAMGAARECARFCLPMSTWSHLVVQCDLNNLCKFLKLRLDKHAQYEIQLIARGMYYLAREVFPSVMKIFDEVSLSKDMSLDKDGFTFEYTSVRS
jgi:thymidylate synthase (FAD)